MPKALRIGITMREVRAAGYDELRDALARDWGRFMAAALPEAAWLPIPNLGGAAAAAFCDRWYLQGLILSGGDDLGATPLRDETERALLDHFSVRGLPVLGICRGLQLMWTQFGGELARVDGHAATRHPARCVRDTAFGAHEGETREVNSFHAWGIVAGVVHAGSRRLVPFACDDGGHVEGAASPDGSIVGVMWHPEREAPAHPQDVALARQVFGYEG